MAMSPGPIDWRWFRRNLIAVSTHHPRLRLSRLDQTVRRVLARSPFSAGEDITRVCYGWSSEAAADGPVDASGATSDGGGSRQSQARRQPG